MKKTKFIPVKLKPESTYVSKPPKPIKMMELYAPHHNDDLVETVQGPITWRTFLLMEKKRIERRPGRIAELHDRFGYSWLMVDQVAVADTKAESSHWRDCMPDGQKNGPKKTSPKY